MYIIKRLTWLAQAALVLMAVLALPGSARPAEVTLTWDPPASYTDGSPATDLGGYNVYYGSTTRNYPYNVHVGNTTSYTIQNLECGTYYFAVTAVDKNGSESAFSNETGKDITLVLYSLSTANGVDGVPVTVYGANFGDRKGAVYVGRRMARITSWPVSGNSVTFISPTRMPYGGYDISVVDCNNYKSINTEPYKVMQARISGLTASSGAPGDSVVLTGEYLGPVPKVFLTYEYNGITKRIPARVTNYSVADSLNSTVEFTVPRLPPNTYLLVVLNSQGTSAGWNFKVK